MTLIPIIRLTFRSPREAASTLLSIGVPPNAVAMAFLLVMILSVLVTEPLMAMVPEDAFGPRMAPISRLLLTAPFSAALVWMIWKLGNAFGGQGRLLDAFVVFVYLEAFLAAGLATMLVLIFASTFLAGLFGLALTLFWAWLFGVFYAEVFDFDSPFKALGTVILAWFIVYVAGIVLLSLVAGGGTV